MDAFESVVAAILQRQGFWTMTSVKVDLTKEQKASIGRPSSPRWELDIVAYRGATREVRVVECKSFLDSSGVDPRVFLGQAKYLETRYKLFTDANLREVILPTLKAQLVQEGFCEPDVRVQLCLAAGKVQSGGGGELGLQQHFNERGWLLLGPSELRAELKKFGKMGYENSVAAIVTKILLRGTTAAPPPPLEADP